MISAIVPTHDRESLLPRALASIEAQSRRTAEVIVVDDGSTDRTAARVAAEFPAVRCVRQPRLGVSAARNRGVAEAAGEWLAFLDSDDEWHPRKLERQLAALEAAPEHRICHTDEIWIRNGRRVNPGARHAKAGGRIFRQCLSLCAISPSSVVIHRDLFEELGGFDESFPACEDYDLWLRITARHPVLLVDEPLVIKHGGHADQLSRTVWGLDRFRIRALEKLLVSHDLDRGDRRAVLETLIEKTAVFAAGAAKRKRIQEAGDYRRRAAVWRAELERAPADGTPPGPV